MSDEEIRSTLCEVEERLARNCTERADLEQRMRRLQAEIRMQTTARKVAMLVKA